MKTTMKRDDVRSIDEHICPGQYSYERCRRHVDRRQEVIDVTIRVRRTGNRSGNGTGGVEIHVGESDKPKESPFRNLTRHSRNQRGNFKLQKVEIFQNTLERL